MARFAWMNLGADPLLPPSNDIDLILCRNVTIYFDDAATQRLYAGLAAALSTGAWLVLGPSDPMPSDGSLLERAEVGEAVVWRRRAAARASRPISQPPVAPTRSLRPPRPDTHVEMPHRKDELSAGLLALEAGSSSSAIEWLRRATFRDPQSAIAQFALARAYLESGDLPRAHAALQHTRRLLEGLAADALVPGSDSVAVETLRQTVALSLEELAA
jgi:chemotaxis protein methyltransferase CheR